MADIEIAPILASLAADSHRCAPVAASVIRRRGDRRRVMVRAVATGSSIALVGATAGTAYAVGAGSGPESLRTPAAGQQTATPAPVSPHHRLRELRRRLHAVRARLREDQNKLARLKALHRAGQIDGAAYQRALKARHQHIAHDRERIQVLQAKIRAAQQSAGPGPSTDPRALTPSPSPTTGYGYVQCVSSGPVRIRRNHRIGHGGATGASAPTPLPTATTCDTDSAPVPTSSPTSNVATGNVSTGTASTGAPVLPSASPTSR
jgi:uncharacterized membrane protein